MAPSRRDTAGSLNDALVWAIRDEIGRRGRPDSQRALAEAIEVDPSTLNDYLNKNPAARKVMYIDTVEKIAEAMGLTALELFHLAHLPPGAVGQIPDPPASLL